MAIDHNDASRRTGPYRGALVGNLMLHDVLAAMAAARPIFHSEADFQHHLAWSVRQFDPVVQARMEIRPIPELSLALDLLLIHPPSGERVAIELKYATRALSVELDGESFQLRNQAAQDVRRHDFIKDLVRLETLVARGVAHRGWAIFLTNDQSFWGRSSRTTVDSAFRLHEGQMLHSSLMWGEAAGDGTRRGRDVPLKLTGSYVLHWTDFSAVAPGPPGVFRVLAVAVESHEASVQPFQGGATPAVPPLQVASQPASVPSDELCDDVEAARLQGMIDELRRLRNRCEPKSNGNPSYLRYSQAISALNWISSRADK